jgi:hypothetical protein
MRVTLAVTMLAGCTSGAPPAMVPSSAPSTAVVAEAPAPPDREPWPTFAEPTPFPEYEEWKAAPWLASPSVEACRAQRVREWLHVGCRSTSEARVTGVVAVTLTTVSCIALSGGMACDVFVRVAPGIASHVVFFREPGDVQIAVDVAWPESGPATESNVLMMTPDDGGGEGACRAGEHRVGAVCYRRCGAAAPACPSMATCGPAPADASKDPVDVCH